MPLWQPGLSFYSDYVTANAPRVVSILSIALFKRVSLTVRRHDCNAAAPCGSRGNHGGDGAVEGAGRQAATVQIEGS
jgi:hypothetical protein